MSTSAIIAIVIILNALIAQLWLGWRFPFSLFGFAIVPHALILFFINKVLRKRVFIGGIEISYD